MKRPFALALAALSLCSCSGPRPLAAKAERREATERVAVARVSRHDLASKLELAAEFRPNQEVDVYAKVSGYLKTIYVDVGDRVRQGQLLAELEVPEMAQEWDQASASLKRTELDVERARGELQRAEANYQIREISYNRLASVVKARPQLVAQQELDDASARLREAEAQRMAAKAALAATEQQVHVAAAGKERTGTMISYLRITAPFAGIITKRLGDPGAMIQAGTASHVQALPVVRLSQVDHLRLVLPVPESIAARIRLGAPVEVRVDSLSRVFQGIVSRFTGKLESATRTMETEVDIANSDSTIKPGMFGYASLTLDRKLDVLGVPVQSLTGSEATRRALVVNEQKRLEERQVRVGMEMPDIVEVLSGLKENELVVIGNRARLKPGMAVEPKLIERSEASEGH